MDLSLIVITLQETSGLLATFALGFLAYKFGLPPMVGFLAVGFLLKEFGFESNKALNGLSDLGITLMLFTIGLKLNLKSLLRIQIWGVASAHMLITTILFGLVIWSLSETNIHLVAGLDIWTAMLIAFALSFSSTVFAVKMLEGKKEMGALYAQIAIGILIVQDIFAVLFLTASTGKLPSSWAFLLFGLPLLRPILYKLMDEVEHGELLVLYSLILAVGGAALFELVGMKADLGALIFGLLMAPHQKATEVSKTLYQFKDLFLIAFFINIGLSGTSDWDLVLVAGVLAILMFVKAFIFFWLLVKTHLRSRTAFLTSVSLANYSEFGLIVGAIGASNGWISAEWLITIAIALAFTFVIASQLNRFEHVLYGKYFPIISRWQSDNWLADEQPVDVTDSSFIVFGMGRVGTGVYNDLEHHFPGQVTGIEFNQRVYERHVQEGRKMVYADAMDRDFWENLSISCISTVFLNLPDVEKNLFIIKQIREKQCSARIAAIAFYDEDIEELKAAGADEVYNFYSEVGYGFAEHVRHNLLNDEQAQK
jgi:predicted Kef-type K+ transport protein